MGPRLLTLACCRMACAWDSWVEIWGPFEPPSPPPLKRNCKGARAEGHPTKHKHAQKNTKHFCKSQLLSHSLWGWFLPPALLAPAAPHKARRGGASHPRWESAFVQPPPPRPGKGAGRKAGSRLLRADPQILGHRRHPQLSSRRGGGVPSSTCQERKNRGAF